ncbi:MAG: DUF302 domain-containing protein [Bacteroidales bacterium]|nr:DUF302 domain-containing protein [Bacteroidales bacterium]
MKEEEKHISKNDMFIENLSPTDFNSTIDRLSKEIANKSWTVSNISDLQGTLYKHGKEVLPIKVFSLCHPNHSSKILERDSERIISSLMPCRISIYEKYDGKTYVSRMNSLIIASSFGGIIKEVMTDSANEVEEIIEKTLRVD